MCVCLRTPFDCLHFDRQSHFNFRIYIFGSGYHSSTHAMHFSARVCVCLPAAFFIMQKNCIPFFSIFFFLFLLFFFHFFFFHFGHFFRKCIQRNCTFHFVHLLCALQGIKNQQQQRQKMHSQFRVDSLAFFLAFFSVLFHFFWQLSTVFALRGFNFNCFSLDFACFSPSPSPDSLVILSFVNTLQLCDILG